MKKPLKILFWVVIGVFVVIAGLSTVYLGMMKKEMATFHPLNTVRQFNNIYAINDNFVNMFLINKAERYIALTPVTMSALFEKDYSGCILIPRKSSRFC